MRKTLPILLLSLAAFPALVRAGDEKILPVESFDGTGHVPDEEKSDKSNPMADRKGQGRRK